MVSIAKKLATGSLLFFIDCNTESSAYELNSNLKNKSEWALWKMLYNPNLNKQARKVIFSTIMAKSFYLQIFFTVI